jgi:hypothetical protein
LWDQWDFTLLFRGVNLLSPTISACPRTTHPLVMSLTFASSILLYALRRCLSEPVAPWPDFTNRMQASSTATATKGPSRAIEYVLNGTIKLVPTGNQCRIQRHFAQARSSRLLLESAVLHDWTFLATCLRSGWRFLGMGLDEWLILSARELLCDCVWLLEIGDASTRAL